MKLKHRLTIAFVIIAVMPLIMYSYIMADGVRIINELGLTEQLKAGRLRQELMDVVISSLLMLTLISILLGLWIYHGVVRKADILVAAANDIKDGNLDTPVEMTGEDELTEVGVAFDAMRIRLKADAMQRLESERYQRQLVSNIAHDLKTPLTAIRGYAEGLMDGVADTPEKQRSYLTTIHNKAEEMDSLLNELTSYSTLDTNQVPYKFERLDVEEYFGKLAETISLDLENQDARLVYQNYVPKGVLFVADPKQLERAIHNVIANSVKYRSDNPLRVQFTVFNRDREIHVEIEDNGLGIKSKDQSHIFERLFRGDAARSSAGGKGIGLSIVKKVIEDHGGVVGVRSKPGRGTVIYFELHKYLPPEEEFVEQDIDRRRRRGNRRIGKGLS